MIAKVSRGWRVGGLIRYLMGPGRANEHTDQHVVASWDGDPARHQPPLRANGEFDVAELAAQVAEAAVDAGIAQTEPTVAAGERVPRGPVWHCSLRNHAEDRVLTDEEWARVVAEVMDRTGIARHGDSGACRWVAIRHAPDHVHIAAVLVRQDSGVRVHPSNDYLRVREVCREVESELGLTATAAVDRTAVRPPTRAEREKAVRRGESETPREFLRRAARSAAVAGRDSAGFEAALAEAGVRFRGRSAPDGRLVGYALAADGDVNGAGERVWYSGRGLARDLALPALKLRWASAPAPPEALPPEAGERSTVGRAERAAAVADAVAAMEHAGAALAAGEKDEAAGVVHAAEDMLHAIHRVTSREPVPARGGAVEAYQRAAGAAGVGQPRRWGPVAAQLRSASWRLMAVRSLVRGPAGADAGVELVVALASLLAEIAAYHEQNRCLAQAHAARTTRDRLVRPADKPVGPSGLRPGRGPTSVKPPVRDTGVGRARAASTGVATHQKPVPGADQHKRGRRR